MSRKVYIFQNDYTDKVQVYSSFKKCFENLQNSSKNKHCIDTVRREVKHYSYDGGDCCMYSQEVL